MIGVVASEFVRSCVRSSVWSSHKLKYFCIKQEALSSKSKCWLTMCFSRARCLPTGCCFSKIHYVRLNQNLIGWSLVVLLNNISDSSTFHPICLPLLRYMVIKMRKSKFRMSWNLNCSCVIMRLVNLNGKRI